MDETNEGQVENLGTDVSEAKDAGATPIYTVADVSLPASGAETDAAPVAPPSAAHGIIDEIEEAFGRIRDVSEHLEAWLAAKFAELRSHL